jgi:uroporphyrinogen decarboxylase
MFYANMPFLCAYFHVLVGTMRPKERVLTTFASRPADRVPINYMANEGIDRRLKTHFGLAPGDDEGLRVALGVDFRGVGAPYRGPKLHPDIPERGVRVNDWGVHTRWVAHASGGYWDYCDFPLQEADEETVANWPMPSPDDFDYSGIEQACRQREKFAIHLGDPGLGCIINTAGFFRSMEQVFVDLITDDPAGLLLIDRFLNIQFEITRRTLEAAHGGIDFLWMGEDLGTQIAPMISRDLFHKQIRPRHQRFFDLAKQYRLPVMLHTCGSSSWAYDEYIEMGLTAVDTLQPEARDMSPEYLKRTFGGRLAFHGCISTAGPVAYGSVADVTTSCRDILEIMMPGGGYCFSPTHCLQDNSPTENVVAMYQAAHQYGRF